MSDSENLDEQAAAEERTERVLLLKEWKDARAEAIRLRVRVRELEAKLDASERRELDYARRARERLLSLEELERSLAATRAQLARLREAGEAVDEADASGDDTVLGVAIRHLRAALWSTTAESERDRAADAAVHRAVDEQAAAARATGRAFTPTDHAALDEAAAEAMERKP